jgi:hypothetical protein
MSRTARSPLCPLIALAAVLSGGCQQPSTTGPSRQSSTQTARVRTDFELRIVAMATASYPVAWDQERFIELRETHRSRRVTALIPAGKIALVELPFTDTRAFQLVLDNLREVGGELKVDRATARVNWSANGVGPTQWSVTAKQLFGGGAPLALEETAGKSGQRVELKIERQEIMEHGGDPGGATRARLLKRDELERGSWRSAGGGLRLRRPLRVLQSVVSRLP